MTASTRFLSGQLFPPSWLVAFFAQAAVDELLIEWIRRFRSEQPLQKRMHKARDYAANCARCGTLSSLTNDCASGTTCSRAHNTARRRTSDHLFRSLPTFG